MQNILVIDDEKIVSDLLADALTQLGYQVKTACGGAEGLCLFETGFFDLVITDIRMPGMDGHAVAQHIRNSDRPYTPIIGISGTPWLFETGVFDGILCKPFPIMTLLDAMKNVMGEALPSPPDSYGKALPSH
ncbi:MAG: response regulator [Desulfobacterales bacterium]|nr:response regulator [Desulfobacterales bacterium]